MSDCNFSINEIKELMETMQKTGLGSLEITDDSYCFKLKAKKSDEIQNLPALAAQTYSVTASGTTTLAPQKSEEVTSEIVSGNVITSPIVGTFYVSSAPDKPPFVKVGDKVKKGDTLFVIESMKLMNEIQSEFDGEISKIMVDDSQGVEYGQPIMVIA